MKSLPHIINPDKTSAPLTPIDPEKREFTESWLQGILQQHPDLLPVDEIESVFSSLVPIGREITTTAGSIDNLFISKAGYPVIVETKLWKNPEARREVLAQAIDYAGQLAKWSFTQLDEETKKHTQMGVIDLIQTNFDPDPDEMPTEEDISRNLRLGRFLILVVSDRIRGSLIDMLNYVNRYPHLATNVGLVELQCYRLPDDHGQILIVPSIVARTEIVERSIVQVSLSPDIVHLITVEQKKSEPGESAPRALTEEAYWEKLTEKSPLNINKAREIFDHFSKFEEITLKMRRTAIVARLNLPDVDQRLSLFFINVEGNLVCWTQSLRKVFDSLGYDSNLVNDYAAELGMLLNHKTDSPSISAPLNRIDAGRLYSIVEKFMRKVLSVEQPTEE